MRRVVVRVIVGLVAALGLAAVAAAENSNVLVLYSNGRLIPGNVEGDRGLHQTVRAPADRPVTLFYEFLDAPRFGGPAFDQMVASYLRGKYASRPPRVIVAVREEALGFLLRHRLELFAQAPVVHAGIDRLSLRSISPLPADVIGVPVRYDFSPTIDLALRWHPRARRLVIVTGAAEPDRAFEAQLRVEAAAVRNRATAEFLAGLSDPRGAQTPRRARRRRRRLHARHLPGRRGPRLRALRERPGHGRRLPRARLRLLQQPHRLRHRRRLHAELRGDRAAGGTGRERAPRRSRSPLAAPAGGRARRR